ncbi:MAG TPA: NAD(P)-binding domain-containing protein [Leptospiraceae bacterium]|nr:NAD(P)-binding domain-containing protein [Leptospiraceae bacterium]HMX33814.1 NAD(P)-binding domain-containing protein [Leptospiraceae bacterium]HMY33306.1 NAD(P)-binding domain-containing protein [Leptospiraceae bacterium]HMZ63043.1 NAD(P)-binding domain-containing protein [Leptospiraceae bacterium]HNA08550.1 NAD(P)-binding domain-containing protein [Leptospiraceae bacterium]
MKVGILGSGVVGQTLAKGFLKHGYEVMIGSRDVSKLSDFVKENSNIKSGNFSETASFGDIIVLTVKGNVAIDAINLAGVKNLEGKTIIDTMNPIGDKPPVNGVLNFFTDLNQSLMEKLQTSFPNLKFVKAFSCIGAPFMVNPNFSGGKPSMFICGNDENAKKDVSKILDQFGFETEDMGKVEAARAIEPLCILWCIPGMSQNKWAHAFKLLKL